MTNLQVATKAEELRAFPPVDAAITKIQAIDWVEVKIALNRVVNVTGTCLTAVGAAVYAVGDYLKKV